MITSAKELLRQIQLAEPDALILDSGGVLITLDPGRATRKIAVCSRESSS